MPKKIEAWECEYCKKHTTRTKGGMRQHEKRCFWNTEVKACMTCKNFMSGGNFPNHCYHDEFNEESEYAGCGKHPNIKKLQHHCPKYVFDEMTLEERKHIVAERNADAQADWDDYNASRM